MSVDELASKARVQPTALEAFEGGDGGLGVSASSRVAKVLGVSLGSVVLTSVAREKALREPTILLKSTGTANVNDSDREALAAALVRARAFVQAGRLLNVERLAD